RLLGGRVRPRGQHQESQEEADLAGRRAGPGAGQAGGVRLPHHQGVRRGGRALRGLRQRAHPRRDGRPCRPGAPQPQGGRGHPARAPRFLPLRPAVPGPRPAAGAVHDPGRQDQGHELARLRAQAPLRRRPCPA
ncbi:unnamed protein product, partial [Heterosigma akashiwo]